MVQHPLAPHRREGPLHAAPVDSASLEAGRVAESFVGLEQLRGAVEAAAILRELRRCELVGAAEGCEELGCDGHTHIVWGEVDDADSAHFELGSL